MNGMSVTNDLEFIGLYEIPGEGIVAALRDVKGTKLFDRQGLTWRILDKRKKGQNSDVEENALARIESISASVDS